MRSVSFRACALIAISLPGCQQVSDTNFNLISAELERIDEFPGFFSLKIENRSELPICFSGDYKFVNTASEFFVRDVPTEYHVNFGNADIHEFNGMDIARGVYVAPPGKFRLILDYSSERSLHSGDLGLRLIAYNCRDWMNGMPMQPMTIIAS